MPRKKKDAEPDYAEKYSLLPVEVVERRTAIEKLRQLELGNAREELNLEERKRNICRIDVALGEFDKFLIDFVEMLTSLPDVIQGFIPTTTPEQYEKVQDYIDDQLQRLSKKRLYLAIESTAEEKALATATKEESQKNAARAKGVKK